MIEGAGGDVSIAHIAGTIEVDEKVRLKKLLFRATRGKALTFFQDFEVPDKDPKGKAHTKSVYIVVFQEGRQIRDKIVRICDSFMGQRFDLPQFEGIPKKIQEVRKGIAESKALTDTSRRQLKQYLTQINQISGDEGLVRERISALEVYKWFVAKEKALYSALNLMKQGQSAYVGFFWSPNDDEVRMKEVLQNYPTTDFKRFNNHNIQPPTYFKINEFTFPFQEIVNTYGIPMYKEVNPAVFACVTFPFLFGVMFGDMGHGSLMFVFAMFLCFASEKLRGSALDAFVQIRYLLLLMSIFAMYNGLIYNEFFAIPIEFFGSCFGEEATSYFPTDPTSPIGYHRESFDCVYTIGLDPRWAQSDQSLSYSNNLKMKISVILGILQMSMGICMKGFNAAYFKKPIDFIFEFIPQIVLILALFGWMDILIIGKWLTTKDLNNPADNETIHRSPAIITTMINIFLNGGAPGDDFDNVFGDKQATASIILVLIVIICVPIMLCVKPCYLSRQHSKNPTEHKHLSLEEVEQVPEGKQLTRNEQVEAIAGILAKEGRKEEEHVFSELFIHQLIETIEFVLGTISNTASYLRLWALSLAHSQLASVFLVQTIGNFGYSA